MLPLALGTPDRPLDVLCLGAHADDIEIGAGGTILVLARAGRLGSVRWVVLSGTEVRAAEARASAARFLEGARSAEVVVETFAESYFPRELSAIKDRFESLKGGFDPDLLLTHRLEDRHQDHRTVAELTWNTYRGHAILEYEIPKYEGDLGHPNLFVELPDWAIERKAELLLEGFPSQHGRDWFDAETFRALARLRGLEARVTSRYAEAFHARKLVLGTG